MTYAITTDTTTRYVIRSLRVRGLGLGGESNHSINQPAKPSITQSIDQLNKQTIKQSINLKQSINQSIKQSTNLTRIPECCTTRSRLEEGTHGTKSARLIKKEQATKKETTISNWRQQKTPWRWQLLVIIPSTSKGAPIEAPKEVVRQYHSQLTGKRINWELATSWHVVKFTFN